MTKDKRQLECTCCECGRDYTITFDVGNPYFCPECYEVRKERISASFAEIAAKFEERKAKR